MISESLVYRRGGYVYLFRNGFEKGFSEMYELREGPERHFGQTCPGRSQAVPVGVPASGVYVVQSAHEGVFKISPTYCGVGTCDLHQCVQHEKLHNFGLLQNLKMKQYVKKQVRT